MVLSAGVSFIQEILISVWLFSNPTDTFWYSKPPLLCFFLFSSLLDQFILPWDWLSSFRSCLLLGHRWLHNKCIHFTCFFISSRLDTCSMLCLFKMRSLESFSAFICARRFHSRVRGFHPINIWCMHLPNRFLVFCLLVGYFAEDSDLQSSVQILRIYCICINVSPVLASKWLAFCFCWSASQTMKW